MFTEWLIGVRHFFSSLSPTLYKPYGYRGEYEVLLCSSWRCRLHPVRRPLQEMARRLQDAEDRHLQLQMEQEVRETGQKLHPRRLTSTH